MAITINGSTGIDMASDDSLAFGDVGISADTLFAGRKNVIINGDFDVWQRGTSGFTTNGSYSSDRWSIGTNLVVSVSQSNFTLGQTDVPNEPKHYLTYTTNAGATSGSVSALIHKIEGVRTFAGQTVTLSFYAKADTAKNIATECRQNFGTGGSPSTTVESIGVTTHSLTTGWQKFEVTFTFPSISGKTIGSNNDDFLEFTIFFGAGSDYNARTNSLGNQSGTFDIAQVQLEKGSQATAFEKRSYGEELALCQRYYETSSTTYRTYSALTTLGNTTTDDCQGDTYKVTKRGLPTVTIISANEGTGKVSHYNASATEFTVSSVAEQTVEGFGQVITSTNFTRDVKYRWIADAEL